jgi:hypothetical protein
MLDEVLGGVLRPDFQCAQQDAWASCPQPPHTYLSLCYQSVLVVPMYIMRVGGEDIVMRAKCWISKSSVKVSRESQIEGQSPSLP